jgi:radical SAM superfamily enzyme YgiQ (UPF0313 family)
VSSPPDPPAGAEVVLATINARYQHASLGLRYLLANAGDLQGRIRIVELVGGRPTEELAERLLACRPRIVALGVYIWNVVQSTELVRYIRKVQPGVAIVLGGPEVSHEADRQPICDLADHVVQGPGDISFAKLVRSLLDGPRPLMRIIAGEQPDLARLVLPYRHYTDRDLRERFIYVEASRGCPFKCEFCLSALDKTAWPFPLDAFLAELAMLHARGARRFKFVDRTFNLKVATGRAILGFFLERLEAARDDPPFLHFELVPDHLPDGLKELIVRFPPGTLQFEIGIQTWNPQVQALISRRQDNAAAEANLRWLRANSHAHLHVDLIAGLPGEDLASFGAGFDRLCALRPHEIQLGILKRLRGAPIARHTQTHGLDFDPEPPYAVRATAALPAAEVARLARCARYWDLVANSGRFVRTLPALLGDAPFARFLRLADWLHAELGRAYGVALEELHALLLRWLVADGMAAAEARRVLEADYAASGAHGRLPFAASGIAPGRPALAVSTPPRQRRRASAPAP